MCYLPDKNFMLYPTLKSCIEWGGTKTRATTLVLRVSEVNETVPIRGDEQYSVIKSWWGKKRSSLSLDFLLRFVGIFLWSSYLVVPDDMSEVSELSLFLSWTMLKSANLEKSVLPWPMRRADLRDSNSRTSSSFFWTSGPPFCKWRPKLVRLKSKPF